MLWQGLTTAIWFDNKDCCELKCKSQRLLQDKWRETGMDKDW